MTFALGTIKPIVSDRLLFQISCFRFRDFAISYRTYNNRISLNFRQQRTSLNTSDAISA